LEVTLGDEKTNSLNSLRSRSSPGTSNAAACRSSAQGRQGLTGWAGVGGVDFFDPDASNTSDSRRRYIFGGAHWSQVGRGRLGVAVTLEQLFRTVNSQLLERRLLAQTHVEF
jgi:hypothetical protein